VAELTPRSDDSPLQRVARIDPPQSLDRRAGPPEAAHEDRRHSTS
jgi:hypothetical protein